jgi:cytochrome P450
MPWMDRIWAKNPLVHSLFPPKGSPVVAFAVARGRERREVSKEAKEDGGEAYNSRDFMSRFIEARAKDPANIPESYITAWATSNMQAGSDTTAIFLRAVVYFLLLNPECERKLIAELVRARKAGRLSDVVTWKESRDLPYLDACIKEAGRLHPAVGFALERVVPRGGVELCGKYIAEGTVVGINAWVAHRDCAVFGEDAGMFKPDRWLGNSERRASMERCLLTVRVLDILGEGY